MTDYEKAVALWQQKQIATDADLAEALNGYSINAFKERHPFDEALIKEMQKLLTQNTYDTRRWQLGEHPREYKHHDYVTRREEVGAPPEEVSEEMAELLEEFKDLPDKKALTAGAYFRR